MKLVRTEGGRTNLHVWRGGRSYEHQKGGVYRTEWNNLCFRRRTRPSEDANLRYHDVREPLPYPPASFDAVYLFHIIEHLTPEEASALLGEVRRVLKPAGILRLSTPDLEDICRAYLERIADADRDPSQETLIRHEWAVLELIDQIVRVEPGGVMKKRKDAGQYDREYARKRFGDVFEDFGQTSESRSSGGKGAPRNTRPAPIAGLRRFLRRLSAARELPRKRAWEAERRFRRSGEPNLWLYDGFSLGSLLSEAGFTDIVRMTYATSRIPEWERFDLDRSTSGDHPIEPSLYMEARNTGVERDEPLSRNEPASRTQASV